MKSPLYQRLTLSLAVSEAVWVAERRPAAGSMASSLHLRRRETTSNTVDPAGIRSDQSYQPTRLVRSQIGSTIIELFIHADIQLALGSSQPPVLHHHSLTLYELPTLHFLLCNVVLIFDFSMFEIRDVKPPFLR